MRNDRSAYCEHGGETGPDECLQFFFFSGELKNRSFTLPRPRVKPWPLDLLPDAVINKNVLFTGLDH